MVVRIINLPRHRAPITGLYCSRERYHNAIACIEESGRFVRLARDAAVRDRKHHLPADNRNNCLVSGGYTLVVGQCLSVKT